MREEEEKEEHERGGRAVAGGKIGTAASLFRSACSATRPRDRLLTAARELWWYRLGLVKFLECSMNEAELLGSSFADGGTSCGAEDSQSLNASVLSALDHCLGHARESLGVECHLPSSESTSR